MKILLTSDIHDHVLYHKQVEELFQQHECDLLALSGDMLDSYKECGLLEQMLRFRHWTKQLMEKSIRTALACGNHDHNTIDFLNQDTKENNLTPEIYPEGEHEEIQMLIQHTEWMAKLSQPLLQTPGETRTYIIEGKSPTLVTCLKHAGHSKALQIKNEITMLEALTHKQKGQKWVVLAHQPPATNGFCPEELASKHNENLILAYQPDFFLCGHFHPGPKQQNTPITKIGKTVLINAGQTKEGKNLQFAILDLKENTLLWESGTKNPVPIPL